MKVVITGGAGFIGSNLAHRLSRTEIEIIVIDNLENGHISNLAGSSVQFVEGDFSDIKIIKQVISPSDFVIHLAAQGSVSRSLVNPEKMFETNILKSIKLLEFCRTLGTKFIFSSSSSIFGENSNLYNSENTPTDPISPYGASKLAFEKIIYSYVRAYEMDAAIFRFFNVFGPRQKIDGPYAAVIPKFITNALRHEEITVFGDGNQTRDFTFVEDVVEVLASTILFGIKSNKPINLAWGNRITVNQIIDQLKLCISDPVKVKYELPRKGDIRTSSNSSSLLKDLFPEISNTSFETGFKKTFDWFNQIL